MTSTPSHLCSACGQPLGRDTSDECRQTNDQRCYERQIAALTATLQIMQTQVELIKAEAARNPEHGCFPADRQAEAIAYAAAHGKATVLNDNGKVRVVISIPKEDLSCDCDCLACAQRRDALREARSLVKHFVTPTRTRSTMFLIRCSRLVSQIDLLLDGPSSTPVPSAPALTSEPMPTRPTLAKLDAAVVAAHYGRDPLTPLMTQGTLGHAWSYEASKQTIKQAIDEGRLPFRPTEAQRADIAYGNVALSNPDVTPAMAEAAVRRNPQTGYVQGALAHLTKLLVGTRLFWTEAMRDLEGVVIECTPGEVAVLVDRNRGVGDGSVGSRLRWFTDTQLQVHQVRIVEVSEVRCPLCREQHPVHGFQVGAAVIVPKGRRGTIQGRIYRIGQALQYRVGLEPGTASNEGIYFPCELLRRPA